jgi:hypothetical protein
MPFLLPILPAIAGTAIGGAIGVGVNKLLNPGGTPGQNTPVEYKPGQLQQEQNPFENPAIQASLQGMQGGIGQQQGFANALGAQGGPANQNQVYGQYQDIYKGQGPNPAQEMLAQSTGANVANQAALAAGQRGASSNVGLIGRQVGQAGSQAQQQGAQQAALLQAQQSLGALGGAGNIAGQQVGQQANALANLNAVLQGNASQVAGLQGMQNQGIANANNNQVNQERLGLAAAQGNQNVQAGVNQTAQENQNKMIGGLTNSLGTAFTPQKKAYGGEIENPKLAAVSPAHRYPEHINGIAALYHGDKFGDVGKMPKFYQGGMAKDGGKVPGKARMAGDHPSNDTVSAKLSPGEVVIPKSVMESEDPVGNAAKFVASLAKQGGKEHGDFKNALAKAIKNRKRAS